MGVASYSSIMETDEGDDEVQFQYELSKFGGEEAVKVLKGSGEMVDEYYDWLEKATHLCGNILREETGSRCRLSVPSKYGLAETM